MVGRHLQVEIQKLVAGGDGLAHLPDGKVLFVPFSLPREKLQVRVSQDKRDYAVGEIEDILEPSEHRVKPRCPYYRVCGGCQFQHVSYEAEIRLKADSLSEILMRQVKTDLRPEAAYPSPQEWEYRTKSEHPAAPHKPNPLIGYYQRRTHKVVDVKDCPVLHPECLDDLGRLREILGKSGESVYDERTGKGNLRHVVLRRSSEGRRVVGLVTRTAKLEAETLRRLLEEFTELTGIVQNINPEPGNRILGGRTEVISGLSYLVESIAGLKLKVSFESFFQANHAQAGRIVELVKDFLKPEKDDVLCDAYAGVGMIGLALASDVKEVIAIESLPSSVKDGRHNAEINGFDNVRWIEGDAGELLSDVKYDLLVLDPPRKGMPDKVISAVVKTKPQKLCYVSCNLSTWARDVRLLIDAGYELKRLIWLDMFPKTAHMELVSLLEIA
jgi:23S rRNA (uracil1939-C5)-methyltransferase